VEPTVAREWLLELLDLVPIVLLSSEPDTAIFNRLLQAGAGGILQADASAEQILHAIKSVAAGLMIFDSTLMPHRPDDDRPTEPLTPREREVLGFLADGLANKEIALRLNISEHTIKFHIRSILGKLGASSRTEAVSRGIRTGLIDL
jgi:DNA-binding NarL/FixJ family response regulator